MRLDCRTKKNKSNTGYVCNIINVHNIEIFLKRNHINSHSIPHAVEEYLIKLEKQFI